MAFADRYLPAVAAPLLRTQLGLSDTQMGILDGPAFVMLYALGMLASWPAARSPHRLRLLAACIACWMLGMLLFALAPSFGVLVAGRALVGLGQAAFVPLALGLIANQAAPGWRARSIAVFTAGSTMGRSLSLLLGGAVLALLARWAPGAGQVHWRWLFLLMAAPNLLLMTLLLRRSSPAPLSPIAVARPCWTWLVQHPGLVTAYFCAAGASVLIVQTIGAWAPSVLQREHTLTPANAALAFGVGQCLASPLGHAMAGLLVDKRSHRLAPMTVVAIALLLTAPLLWGVTHTDSAPLACGLLALISLLGGTAAVAALAGLPMIVPEPSRDAGFRLFMVFITVVGVGLGPYLAGRVSDHIGPGQHGLSSALELVCFTAMIAGVLAALLTRGGWLRATTAFSR